MYICVLYSNAWHICWDIVVKIYLIISKYIQNNVDNLHSVQYTKKKFWEKVKSSTFGTLCSSWDHELLDHKAIDLGYGNYTHVLKSYNNPYGQ